MPSSKGVKAFILLSSIMNKFYSIFSLWERLNQFIMVTLEYDLQLEMLTI